MKRPSKAALAIAIQSIWRDAAGYRVGVATNQHLAEVHSDPDKSVALLKAARRARVRVQRLDLVANWLQHPSAPVWHPIATAPKDGSTVLLYAPAYDGGPEPLPAIVCTAARHPDGGWCVDELRVVTHWMPVPVGPAS